MYTINRLPEFERELKALTKRFRTLPEDLEVLLRSQVRLFHCQGIDTGGIVQVSNLEDVAVPIYKVLKFACKVLKGRGAKTGLRLIYAFHEELNRIDLVEIYFKADQTNENRDRIRRYYSS